MAKKASGKPRYKKVISDVTDVMPTKMNGAMGFGTWEGAMANAKKRGR
jgi:hypothetical protein